MTLTVRYVCFVTGVVLAVMGFFTYENLRFEESLMMEDDRKKANLMTEIIKNGLTTVMLEGRGTEFQKYLDVMNLEGLEAVRLLRPDGTVICSSMAGEKGKTVRVMVDTGVFASRDADRYWIQVPIYNEKHCMKCHAGGGKVLGILGIEFLMDGAPGRAAALRKRTLAGSLAALLALSASLYFLTSFSVARPIKHMTETMKQAEKGDLGVRFLAGRRDEIGALAASLNSMLFELNRTRQELESHHFDALQRVEKMATIGELAAAVAHEIKNPLAGISGAIQVLAEDFSPEDHRRAIINEVLGEIDRLDKAVRDLLSFAKPPEPNFLKTSIAPVIERAIRLVGPQAKKQGVKINLISADDADVFWVDPELMQQVFLNMMMNAMHSMPGGGTLTVATSMGGGTEGDIVISDTGKGIHKEEMKNIFKPFFTTKHAGTGLGLAISKSIVEKHGGRITVESHVGSGSSFRITLPLYEGGVDA